MKVRCIKLLDSSGRESDDTYWFQLGKIYQVMGIDIDTENQRSLYVLISNYDKPEPAQMVLALTKAFEIVSDNIPSNWDLRIDSHSQSISLIPLAWRREDFFERFHENDPEMFPIFERERDIIMCEDPL